jgi:O-antigen biosynthesis protein
MTAHEPNMSDRLRQTVRLLRTEGSRSVVDRLRSRVADRIRPSDFSRLPIPSEQFARAGELASNNWNFPMSMQWSVGGPLRLAWICRPPGAGSGGHTTMFRMAGALERAGHECHIYIQDEHGWSLRQHRETIRRWWPWVRAEIRDFASGVDDSHAIFATGWTTAWALLSVEAAGARCYFVQDFEPSFYPAGSEYLLAEATYRFPLHAITAGRWLAQYLGDHYGTDVRHFDFGCDIHHYKLIAGTERAGICYYCRPDTPRRAHELAVAGLALFAEANPRVPIHTFGQNPGRLPFRVETHGLLTPSQLSILYNGCIAGVVLSATNVSLVPYEMLAAGCIPIVNDGDQNRMVLNNPHVIYCLPMPHEIAHQLNRLVNQPRSAFQTGASVAASSIDVSGWGRAETQFVAAVEQIVAAAKPPSFKEPRSPSGAAAHVRPSVQ